jgi:hypothetical protein
MKPTESSEQLLARFSGRSMQLQAKLAELQSAYDEYIKIKNDLLRLEGSEQAVRYIAFGELPNDGNHGGMKNHKPVV